MSDNPKRCFIDTNIWLYAFIKGANAEKTRKAKQVIDTHDVVLVHKLSMKWGPTCFETPILRKNDFEN